MQQLNPVIPQSKAFLNAIDRLKRAFFKVNVYQTANHTTMFVVKFERESVKHTHITQAINCIDDTGCTLQSMSYDKDAKTMTFNLKNT